MQSPELLRTKEHKTMVINPGTVFLTGYIENSFFMKTHFLSHDFIPIDNYYIFAAFFLYKKHTSKERLIYVQHSIPLWKSEFFTRIFPNAPLTFFKFHLSQCKKMSENIILLDWETRH